MIGARFVELAVTCSYDYERTHTPIDVCVCACTCVHIDKNRCTSV